jgi:hypothetical protein
MFKILQRIFNPQAFRLALVLPLVVLATGSNIMKPPASASLMFRVSLSQSAADEIANLGLHVPVDGRLYIIVTTSDDGEPRDQIDVTGVPFWGKDVFNFSPQGKGIIIRDRDQGLIGFPLEHFGDLPEGDYYIQAFLTVYTKFHRSDGAVLLMHQDAGEGQWQFESPGNAYSQPQLVHLGGKKWGKVNLELTEVIPPIQELLPGEVLQQGNPRDTEWVKYVKIRSEAVSAFWGQDMYVGANVLLPKGYTDNPDTYYPVIYLQGHFPGDRAPFGFRPNNSFYNFWTSGDAPPFIAVTFRDATPYYDTSYGVDSANNGPYGQAIFDELIPYLETHFRIIRAPYARVLAGGSTGGWEALAMKVFWPDFYGGTWAWCPDGIDFHYHQLIDVYDEDNAYFTEYDYNKVERPSARRSDGNIVYSMKMENDWELAMGTNDRSGGQWDIWEAVYSPRGADGYPAPVWDPITGEIDHVVAEAWKAYDLNYIMQQNWAALQPYLDGQLTITTGMVDTYFLEEAVYLFDEYVQTASPPADIEFDYGFRRPHCWRGESQINPGQQMGYPEFIQVAWDWVQAHQP